MAAAHFDAGNLPALNHSYAAFREIPSSSARSLTSIVLRDGMIAPDVASARGYAQGSEYDTSRQWTTSFVHRMMGGMAPTDTTQAARSGGRPPKRPGQPKRRSLTFRLRDAL